jgi:hypothetical protein
MTKGSRNAETVTASITATKPNSAAVAAPALPAAASGIPIAFCTGEQSILATPVGLLRILV